MGDGGFVQIGGGRGLYRAQRSAVFDEAQARLEFSGRPMFAHLTIDNRCHLKCAHCYETQDSHPPAAFQGLSLTDYDRIFDELASLGVLVVTFSGGEPFLRRDFFDLVELARKKRFAVRIYTSGTLVDEVAADRLAALQVSEVHVSLYSHLAPVHDGFTGVAGAHEKSVTALRLLHARGVRTVLKSNIMTINVDALDELLALARDLGADYQLDPTVKPRMNGDRSPLAFAVSPDVLRQKVYANPALERFVSLDEAQGVCTGANPRAQGGSMCAAARGVIAVGADGGVSPCAFFPTAGGNAKAQPIADIWHRSPLFREVRAQTFSSMNGCSTCSVGGACSPCIAYSLIEHGDLRACSSAARQQATGRARAAKDALQADRKGRSGRALRVLHAHATPYADGAGKGALSAEP